MLIVPAVDIMGGNVVRLERGEFDKVKIYSDSPVECAQRWESQGAPWIHVVDLDGAKTGIPKNAEMIGEIARSLKNSEIDVSGGVRSVQTVETYLKEGASRIILSTKAIQDPDFLKCHEITAHIEKLAVSIDFKDISQLEAGSTETAINGWVENIQLDVASFIQALAKAGVRYINFSDRARDGMMMGLDGDKISSFLTMAREAAQCSMFFTYAAGVTTLDDIKALNVEGGPDAVIVGRALYEGAFTYQDAVVAGDSGC